MQTVLVIHGGDTFLSMNDFVEHVRTRKIHFDRMKPREDWKKNLETDLSEGFDVYLPRMPLGDNADYDLWKLWFERIMGELKTTPLLIGHSLGAMFLVKYYSESVPKDKLPALFLVAPEYLPHNAPKEERNSFTLKSDISPVMNASEKVVFFHSEDDPVVPFENHEKFKKTLPQAEFYTFPDKGHFLDAHFSELVQKVRELR